MLSVTARLFTPGEREALRRRARRFPWFALWRDREEMKAGMAEVISGSVSRAWSENGCGPPCCPNAYLIDTGEGRFVAVSTWEFLEGDGDHFPGSSFTVVRTPVSKRVLSATASGVPVRLSEPSLMEVPFGTAGCKCEILDFESLPPELRERLSSPSQSASMP